MPIVVPKYIFPFGIFHAALPSVLFDFLKWRYRVSSQTFLNSPLCE